MTEDPSPPPQGWGPLAWIGLIAGGVAILASIGITMVAHSMAGRAPTDKDCTLSCTVLISYGLIFTLMLGGGLCSLVALLLAPSEKRPVLPAVVGLFLNGAPLAASLFLDMTGFWKS